jgi:iron-sulfur cluster assembly accessory protein
MWAMAKVACLTISKHRLSISQSPERQRAFVCIVRVLNTFRQCLTSGLATMTDVSTRPSATVAVTAAAARRIGEIAAGEGRPTCLRISVEGGGCSGFQYKYDLVPSAEDEDLVIVRDGAQVLIDPVSLEYMAGSEVDFVDDLMGAAFKINNPKATAGCGCGTSFSL